jgi:hypothetical protein
MQQIRVWSAAAAKLDQNQYSRVRGPPTASRRLFVDQHAGPWFEPPMLMRSIWTPCSTRPGVESFLFNEDGVVYVRNLGPTDLQAGMDAAKGRSTHTCPA